MKKNFLKFAVVAGMFAFAACSSDDGGSKNNGGGNNTGDCAAKIADASAAVASFTAGTMSCEAALAKVEAAWEDECLSDNQAIALGNQLPCFDINDYN